MALAWILNALALAFGVGLGARALFDPNWASRLARLRAEDARGFSALRALGALLAASHAAALLMTLMYALGGEYVIGVAAAGGAVVLGALWAGSCGGRLLSMLLDRADTRLSRLSAAVEAALALSIAAPWLAWYFARA